MIRWLFDLEKRDDTLESLRTALFREQGRPEEFRSASPRSIFYELPYHLVKFRGKRRLAHLKTEARDPFARAVVHFLTVLCLRSNIVERLGVNRIFTLEHAKDACDGDAYAASMTLGQMIKVGLVEFDPAAPWDHASQQYRCRV